MKALILEPIFEAMPPELRTLQRWVCWKGGKVPMKAMGLQGTASTTDPNTWSGIDAAASRYSAGGYSGVGFVLNGDGIVGVDLDSCVDNGEPDPVALAILEEIGCQYVELSPSRTGLHGFGYGELDAGKKGLYRGIKTELYSNKRYLTMTGHTLKSGGFEKLTGLIRVADQISSSSSIGDIGGRIALISSIASVPSVSLVSSVSSVTSDSSVSSITSVSSVSSVKSFEIPEHLLPKNERERNAKLFQLARYLKGVLHNPSRENLREIVINWHLLALPYIATKEFGISWADFLYGYEKVHTPHGAVLNEIMGNLPELPSAFFSVKEFGSCGELLMRICLALQSKAGDAPFFLGARTAGEQLGLSHTHSATLLKVLTNDGHLNLITKGKQGHASRYRVSGFTSALPTHIFQDPQKGTASAQDMSA
jgi:hypothetical protein